MMTFTVISLLASLSILACICTLNSMTPIKMTTVLLAYSAFLLSFMNIALGSVWFPLILLLLFTGGILVVFMIISSVTPNQSSSLMNYSLLPLTLMFLLTWMSSSDFLVTTDQTKWFLQSGNAFQISIFLILGYFIGFIMIVSKDSATLRTTICCMINFL